MKNVSTHAGRRTELATLRRSSAAAKEIVSKFAPKRQLAGVLEAVAHSIQIADQADPSKWGIRVNRDSIMLKVGFVEVLQFGEGWFHQLVSKQSIPSKSRSDRRLRFSNSEYLNAPGCGFCDVSIANASAAYALVLRAHEEAIRIAAKRQRQPSTVRDHSPGFITFLAQELDMLIPQPAYLSFEGQATSQISEELPADYEFTEGAAVQVLVNRYERDAKAREHCINHHGTSCAACGLSLGTQYGPAVDGLIHVHHLKPLSVAASPQLIPFVIFARCAQTVMP